MPTPGPGVAISFSQVNTEFALTTPSPMDAKFRIAPGNYTPASPVIPTTPAGIFPIDVLHGRTKGVPAPTPFITTFTTPGSWTSTVTGNIKVLVVAGGGGGGDGRPAFPGGQGAGGGGGAGGVVYCTSYPVVQGSVYPFVVGTGGAGGTASAGGVSGTNSTFGPGITANGGGRGGGVSAPSSSGGSGGGGAGQPQAGAGSGTTQPSTPQPAGCTNYGNPGGTGAFTPFKTSPARSGNYVGGGGGGAGGAGANAPPGIGGQGISISITGTPVFYGIGGAGGRNSVQGPSGPGYGGGGGGGSWTANGSPAFPTGCVIIAYP